MSHTGEFNIAQFFLCHHVILLYCFMLMSCLTPFNSVDILVSLKLVIFFFELLGIGASC